MITAYQARELVKDSDENVARKLNYLDREIRQAATDGKKEFFPDGEEFKPIDKYSSVMSVFQQKIKAELVKSGFTFEIATIHHPSTLPGFKSMDNEWSHPWDENKIKVGW